MIIKFLNKSFNTVTDFLDSASVYIKKPVRFYYNVKHFIHNLFYYAPFLWSDRDWSDVYIFKALLYKLKKQEKFIRSGHWVGCTKEADNIQFCIKLLETRIVPNDYYCTSGLKKLDEKWGVIEFKITPDSDANSNYSSLIVSRKGIKTIEDEKQEKVEFTKAMEHKEYLINQDIEYLFSYMTKHIRYWWD